jgi:hypothetical protein
VIWEFKEVEYGNLGIQLNNYTFTRALRQLGGGQIGPRTVFKEEAYKGC